jgi:hypothetical protein
MNRLPKKAMNVLKHIVENFMIFRTKSIVTYYFQKWKKIEDNKNFMYCSEDFNNMKSGGRDTNKKKVGFMVQSKSKTDCNISKRNMKNLLINKHKIVLKRILF